MFGVDGRYNQVMAVGSFVALLAIAGVACTCLSHTALAEGGCPPGQSDKTKHYKGKCVPLDQLDPETGRLRTKAE